MRRWTGLSPSRISGRARDTITLMAYSKNDFLTSFSMSIGMILLKRLSCPKIIFPLYIQVGYISGIVVDELFTRVHIIAHQISKHLVGLNGIINSNLHYGAIIGIHGG